MDDREEIALLARAAERGLRITVPATALAQAIRVPSRQARLRRLIRQASIDLVSLDGDGGRPLVGTKFYCGHCGCACRHLRGTGGSSRADQRCRRFEKAIARLAVGGGVRKWGLSPFARM